MPSNIPLQSMSFTEKELVKKRMDDIKKLQDTQNDMAKGFEEEQLKKEQLKNKSEEQNISMRKIFSVAVSIFVVLFTVVMFYFLDWYFCKTEEIPSAVIITLISTSFIEVLGLMTVVLLFIFPKK